MNDEQIAHIRALTESVLERARNDEAYLEEFRNDPITTLQAAGLDDAQAEHLGLELTGDEVSGFAKPRYCRVTEDGLGCWITICTGFPYTY